MSASQASHGVPAYRLIEQGLLVAFVAAAALLLVLLAPAPSTAPAAAPEVAISVRAYAIPNQGWAPLTVYFSAFGAHSPAGRIVLYEWDLDGNGRFDSRSESAGGYATYTYAKPGDYVVTLRVTDEQRHSATASTTVSVRHPTSSSVDYWTIFDDSQVRRVDFYVSQANWNRMWADPGAKLKVEADVELLGERVERVGLSMKGNGSLEASGDKKSWKIDTDEFVPDQEFRNLKQLLLHNNFMDASLLRDKLAYEMMGFAGVPTSHTAYVELWIDITDDDLPATFWGVYTLVERLDQKYVDNRFGRDAGGGNLYKADAWFEQGAADLAYYGEEIADYPQPRGETAYHLRSNRDRPDYADIIALCRVIDGQEYATPAEYAQALEPVFNVDGFLRYMAVIFTNLNLDTYPYTGNNFFIYHNLATGRFEFLPWDLNNSWGHFAGDASFPLFGSSTSLGPLQYAPLFSKTFEVPEYRLAYAAYVDLLVRFFFNEQQIGARAQALHELIGPYLTQNSGDKMYVGPSAIFGVDDFERDRVELVGLTRERSAFLRTALADFERTVWDTN